MISPLSVWLLGGLLISVLIGGAIFASQASYARKEAVVGWLSPKTGIVRATAARGGIATELLISEGDRIEAGQPIARMRLSASTDEGDVGAAIAATLEAQAKATQTRARATLRQLETNASRLRTQKSGLESELAQMDSQIELQKQRVDLITADAERARAAAEEGLMPKIEADARGVALVDAKLALANLEQSIILLRNRITDMDAQLASIPVEKELALAEAEAASAALAERTTQTNIANEYIVTSPVGGRIDAIPVRQGQSLAPGTAIAAISPLESELIAELYVPSRAAGFIKADQDVRLKYQAFPHQRFGVGLASIESVSLTVLAPSEVAIPGVQLQEPVFRVLAKLEREDIDAYGETVPLRSGMLVSADIVIDRRSLLEWLLDPLYASGRR
ncbi:MAG: HlyD family efflux transporter periplasmic adaptor subunit [Hyphomonadaceae bacterium]